MDVGFLWHELDDCIAMRLLAFQRKNQVLVTAVRSALESTRMRIPQEYGREGWSGSATIQTLFRNSLICSGAAENVDID